MVAQRKGGKRSQASAAAPTRVVESAELLSAVSSLYKDQIKPVSRILRRRLAEQTSQPEVVLDIDVKQLRALCQASSAVVMENEEGGDWSVHLVGYASTFIDVYDQNDPYPTKLWADFAAYCKGGSGAALCLPGGRYASARALVQNGLSFFSTLSLGQVCHVVQLALAQKKFLGYSNGCIVPYGRSQTMLKEQSAKSHYACSGATGPIPVANWDLARGCLWQILQSSPAGQLPLPNVKRIFRRQFHMELSETAFGYSKVSELLQAPQFQDICELELRGHGYVVSQKVPAGIVTATNGSDGLRPSSTVIGEAPSQVEVRYKETLCLEEALTQNDPVHIAPSIVRADPKNASAETNWCLAPSAYLSFSQDGQERAYKGVVHNTFIHFSQVPSSPTIPASKSMPAISYRGCDAEDSDAHCPSEDSTAESSGADGSSSSSRHEQLENPLEVLLGGVRDGGARSLDVGTPLDDASFCTPGGARSALRTPEGRKPEHRINFCLDEPLALDEALPSSSAAHSAARAPAFPSPSTRTPCSGLEEPESGRSDFSREWAVLMAPDGFAEAGFVVANTFLQARTRLPTPYRKKEMLRSRSTDL